MEKYIDFLETTDVYVLENRIKGVTFYKFKNQFIISFTLECKKNHLQPLRELGLNIDFSDKRVGMAWNQNSLGGTGNNLSVNCTCNLLVFKNISKYFRDDFRPNLLNDVQLQWAKFPFSPAKIKQVSSPILNSEKVNELISIIRQNVHKRKYNTEAYNFIVVQRAIGRYSNN